MSVWLANAETPAMCLNFLASEPLTESQQMHLTPEHPLSQVVFIFDYVQLVFEEARFTLWNAITINLGSTSISQGQDGFADGLVGLIGQPVQHVDASATSALELKFVDGSVIKVARRDARNLGPEAFEILTDAGEIVVEMNE